MKWLFLILTCSLFSPGKLLAQEITFGASGFVEYQRGTLPIVISVPHGGSLSPDDIPDRNCNAPNFTKDLNTIEAARAISAQLEAISGCYPHIIVNHLHRKKVDCNRSRIIGTCFEPAAEQVWDEYHQFLETALQHAGQENNGNKFLIDLHGHGHDFQQIELGYLIPGITLQALNSTLDIDDPLHQTSIEQLIDNNILGLSRSELLRGNLALGSLLSDRNFPTVPSNAMPFPFNSNEYFSGGFITKTYSDPQLNDGTIAIQAELNYDGVRDSPEHIEQFGFAFAQSLYTFIFLHREQDLTLCNETPVIELPPEALLLQDLVLYPNPARTGLPQLNIAGKAVEGLAFVIHDVMGQVVGSGLVEQYKIPLRTTLTAGVYFISTLMEEGEIRHTRRFVLVD